MTTPADPPNPNPAPPADPPADPPAETAKITLAGGIVVEVPKEQAEAYHAAAQKTNAERDELARRIGAIEAEKAAAEAEAKRKADEAEAIRLAKDGEIERARELLTAETEKRLGAVGERLKRQEIEAAVRRAHPGLDSAAVTDIVTLVSPRARYDVESGGVAFLGDDGQPAVTETGEPAGADAFLAEFLKTRQHFVPASVPRPTGGDDHGKPPAPAGSIRLADVPKITPEQAKAIAEGRLKVVAD